jgi:hypothetical protein
VDTEPADNAPSNPPSVRIEDTKANSGSDMLMQGGRVVLNELAASGPQIRAFWGALSSAYGLSQCLVILQAHENTHKMESKLERT